MRARPKLRRSMNEPLAYDEEMNLRTFEPAPGADVQVFIDVEFLSVQAAVTRSGRPEAV